MMCIACEQEFMWLAYLESRGLDPSDSAAMRRSPFAPPPDKASSPPAEGAEPAADKPNFVCDDPTGE
jgi:hypothetical protein